MVLAPNSHEASKGDVRSIALIRRHRATTRAEMANPIVSIATAEFPGPVERKPFMKERFGIKK